MQTKLDTIGFKACYISEITVAELKFGAKNSLQIAKNWEIVDEFISQIDILPIFGCLDFYAGEKARLRKLGTPIADLDLLIGASAVAHNLIMVTNNTSHFARIDQIILEDWTK